MMKKYLIIIYFLHIEETKLIFALFHFSETEKNLKDLKKIDKDYFQNTDIKFLFKSLDNFIEDSEKFYTEDEIEILKNIKNNLKNLEKDEETLYNYFKIYKDLSDFEICFYKISENNGYCIIIHL